MFWLPNLSFPLETGTPSCQKYLISSNGFSGVQDCDRQIDRQTDGPRGYICRNGRNSWCFQRRRLIIQLHASLQHNADMLAHAHDIRNKDGSIDKRLISWKADNINTDMDISCRNSAVTPTPLVTCPRVVTHARDMSRLEGPLAYTTRPRLVHSRNYTARSFGDIL